MELSSPRLSTKTILAAELKMNWKVKDNIEHTILYSTVLLLLSTGVCLLLAMDFAVQLPPYSVRILIAAAFFSLGILHVIAFPRLMRNVTYSSFLNGLGYTALLGLLIAAVTFFSVQLQGKNDFKFLVIAVCSFLVPSAIFQSIQNFIILKPKAMPYWTLPTGIEALAVSGKIDRNISFKIKIKVRYIDNEETCFELITCRHLPLGTAFGQFLKENPDVRIKNPRQEKYGWQFTKQNLLGKRALDPLEDLVSNGIDDKNTVVIERISI